MPSTYNKMRKRLVLAAGLTLACASVTAIVSVNAPRHVSTTSGSSSAIPALADNNTVPGIVTAQTSDSALPMTSVSGKLIWNDADDAAKKRPGSVTVKLLSYNTGNVVATREVTSSIGWFYSFDNVAAKGEHGEDARYKVVLEDADGYAIEYNGYDIVATYAQNDIAVAVNLEWDDDGDRDGLRPDSVKVELDRANEDRDIIVDDKRVVELSDANGWSYTFTGIETRPEDAWMVGEAVDARTDAEYTFAEVMNLGDLSSNHTVMLKNVHVPYKTDVVVNNVWEADEDADKPFKPESVTAVVEGDDGYRETVTMREDDTYDGETKWQGIIEGLPRFHDHGKETTYRVKDGSVHVDIDSQSEYESTYEYDVDEEETILGYEPRYDEESLNGNSGKDDEFRLANKFVNRYMQLTTDGTQSFIPEYEQVWYEGDEKLAPRTDAGARLDMDSMPYAVFAGWKSEDPDGKREFQTVKDLAGNTRTITVTTYTYRPVVERKSWIYARDRDTNANVLLVCSTDALLATGPDKDHRFHIDGKLRAFEIMKTGWYSDKTDASTIREIPADDNSFFGTHDLEFTHPYYDSGKVRHDDGKDSLKASPWGRALTIEEMEEIEEFAVCDVTAELHPQSCAGWFTNCKNLKRADLHKVKMDECVNTHDMFSGCSSLGVSTDTVLGLEDLNFAKLREAGGMFNSAQIDASLFTTTWSGKRFPSLAHSCEMFMLISVTGNTDSLNITFDFPELETAWRMFAHTEDFHEVVFKLNTPKIRDISSMFNSYTNVTYLSVDMDFSNVEMAINVFLGDTALEAIDFPSGFSMPKATQMRCLFQGCGKLRDIPGFTSPNPDGSYFRCENAQYISRMFESCQSLGNFIHMEGIDFSRLDTNAMYYEDAGGDKEPMENGYQKVFNNIGTKSRTVYINPSCNTKLQAIRAGMLINGNNNVTFELRDLDAMSLHSLVPANLLHPNMLNLAPVFANYAKSGFVVRHAGESADKGQGRTLGDKKVALTIHHRVKKIEGAPVVAPPATVMPPVAVTKTEPQASVPQVPVAKLGDSLVVIAAVVVLLTVVGAVAHSVTRRRRR